jgi:hypothetical protein
LRIDAQEVVLGGAVGFPRVVDDLDHEQRLFASHGPPPERAKGRVIVEADATGIAPIGGRAVRLVGGAVTLDHDAVQFRAPHAVDRVERDAMRLFDDVSVDRGPVRRHEKLVGGLISTLADLAEAGAEAAPARSSARIIFLDVFHRATIHVRLAAPATSAGMR